MDVKHSAFTAVFMINRGTDFDIGRCACILFAEWHVIHDGRTRAVTITRVYLRGGSEALRPKNNTFSVEYEWQCTEELWCFTAVACALDNHDDDETLQSIDVPLLLYWTVMLVHSVLVTRDTINLVQEVPQLLILLCTNYFAFLSWSQNVIINRTSISMTVLLLTIL